MLSTLYSKYAINVTRLKAKQNFDKYVKPYDESKHKDYKTFEQMLTFRQRQASKSILVKIHSFECIGELEKFCQRYVSIQNMFPYTTMNDQNFVLMELDSENQVEHLREIAQYKSQEECIYLMTPLFLYTLKEIAYIDKKKPPSLSGHPYSKFKIPNLNEIRKQLQQKASVSDQMMLLCSLLQCTDLNIRLRFHTAAQISYFLSRIFFNLSVIPFGSSVNGFGQTGCDLDLLCKVETSKSAKNEKNMKTRFLYLTPSMFVTDRSDQKEFLETVASLMKTCMPGFTNVKKILEARVPIIKFYNMNTNMQCDLSSTNVIALHMSELLYLYAELDWRVRPLVCTIRKWARNASVTKEMPGHWITNFSLTLLIIFYLQTRSILPSLNGIKYYADLHRRVEKRSEYDPWQIKWMESFKQSNDESLYNLLYGFFEYYSIFDYKRQAICVREARLKQKKDNSPLYIYNPFDMTLNVSKNITVLELSRIIDNFRNALHVLLESQERDVIIKLMNMDLSHNTRSHNVYMPQKKSNEGVSTIKETSAKEDEQLKESEVIHEELITNECDNEDAKKIGESIIK